MPIDPTPKNVKLYAQARKKFAYMKHSAYKSGHVIQEYKRLGGTFLETKDAKAKQGNLTRWFKEEWRNQRGSVGYQKKGDLYRPTHRVTKKTPVTWKELSKKEISRARVEKQHHGRVKKFKQPISKPKATSSKPKPLKIEASKVKTSKVKTLRVKPKASRVKPKATRVKSKKSNSK